MSKVILFTLMLILVTISSDRRGKLMISISDYVDFRECIIDILEYDYSDEPLLGKDTRRSL
jgi:hypothetical protein